MIDRKELDEDKYFELLNRQSRAHEKVAIYLALLNKQYTEI